MDELRATVQAIEERAGLVARRDQLIAQAHEDRFTWEEIAAATGLSRQACYNAEFRARKSGFVPKPFER
jgi:DNA-directed RNA polymerase specialized sigma24 family protein